MDLGKQAVLVAAENAAKQETGKYWFSNKLSEQSYVVRAESGTYAVAGARIEDFSWTGAEPGVGTTFHWRELPAEPLTPADEAGWKKAGAPAKIKVWSTDKSLTLDASKGSEWKNDGTSDGSRKWLRGELTLEEMQKLPTDPKQLAERFFNGSESLRKNAMIPEDAELPAHMKTKEFRSRWPITVVGRLNSVPLPPKVRAGLMRALAAQPGVTAIGETTDSLGRKGVALASLPEVVEVTGEYGGPAEDAGTYESREEIVFAKETGKVLARRTVLTKPGATYRDLKPGFVIYASTVRDSGWTDTKPTPPVEQPS
ncbi:hypothetical protein BJF79_03225 [Actinomadura sp. CNU-125]|nr:hypothetical protein BJF79_03225 [Actinomadura sp. CNU-125]